MLKPESELQKERLEEAQYNAIGKLTGGISHEINTPLTIISGTMEMLKESIDKIENDTLKTIIHQDLQTINIQLNKIKNITESMREIADIKTFKIEKINIYRTIVISLRLLHNKSKHITKINLIDEYFSLDIDREKYQYFIHADARKIEQVIMAIVDNALDQLTLSGTMVNNKLDITITQDKEKTLLCFSDNGGGVPQEILQDIFKPFHSNKIHKGLGIGLSIAKKILDQHHFHIDISNATLGAVVTITIPHQ